jgi:hypothetical protein
MNIGVCLVTVSPVTRGRTMQPADRKQIAFPVQGTHVNIWNSGVYQANDTLGENQAGQQQNGIDNSLAGSHSAFSKPNLKEKFHEIFDIRLS